MWPLFSHFYPPFDKLKNPEMPHFWDLRFAICEGRSIQSGGYRRKSSKARLRLLPAPLRLGRARFLYASVSEPEFEPTSVGGIP